MIANEARQLVAKLIFGDAQCIQAVKHLELMQQLVPLRDKARKDHGNITECDKCHGSGQQRSYACEAYSDCTNCRASGEMPLGQMTTEQLIEEHDKLEGIYSE